MPGILVRTFLISCCDVFYFVLFCTSNNRGCPEQRFHFIHSFASWLCQCCRSFCFEIQLFFLPWAVLSFCKVCIRFS